MVRSLLGDHAKYMQQYVEKSPSPNYPTTAQLRRTADGLYWRPGADVTQSEGIPTRNDVARMRVQDRNTSWEKQISTLAKIEQEESDQIAPLTETLPMSSRPQKTHSRQVSFTDDYGSYRVPGVDRTFSTS